MKRYFFVLTTLLLLGCNSDDDNNNQVNCNFLVNTGVNLTVNLNLPQFSELQFPGASMRVEGQGNGGIILIRVGGTLLAWDGADPNVPLSSCSILQVTGPTAASTCEDPNEYSLTSGRAIGENAPPCTLLAYRVEPIGDSQYLVSN